MTLANTIGIIVGVISFIILLLDKRKEFVEERHFKLFNHYLEELSGDKQKFLKKRTGIISNQSLGVNRTARESHDVGNKKIVMLPTRKPEPKSPSNSIIIALGVMMKQEILDDARNQGYDQEASEEIADCAIEEFMYEEQQKGRIPNEEVIKSSIDKVRKNTTRKINNKQYEALAKIYKKKEKKTLNGYYNTNIRRQRGKVKTIKEIINEKKLSQPILDDSKDTNDLKFSRTSIEKMMGMKKAWLISEDKFRDYVEKTNIERRSEEIYAYILEHQGLYLRQIFWETEIPYSTISRYISKMTKQGITIKIQNKEHAGNKKDVYPSFKSQEIKNYEERFINSNIALRGFYKESSVQEYPEIVVKLKKEYENKPVISIGTLEKKEKLVFKEIYTQIDE